MPLAWELTGEIEVTPPKNTRTQRGLACRYAGGSYSETVVDDLISVIERPELHYEAVLGHLELQFRRQRVLPQEYHGLYSWLVELVYYLYTTLGQ